MLKLSRPVSGAGRSSALLWPSIALLAVFFIVPMWEVLRWSVADEQGYGASLFNFSDVLTAGVYVQLLLRTFLVAAVVAISCLILGYLIALQVYKLRSGLRTFVLLAIITPMWLSVLVRTYAWMVLIGREGLINRVLLDAAIIQEPLRMLFTRGAVYLTMTQILLPIVILSSFSAMSSIDTTIVRAARVMGASRIKAFFSVFLPLTAVGAINGAILVFVFSLGYFVTPALVGGPDDSLVANVISTQVTQTLQWNYAAVLAIVLIGSALIVLLPVVAIIRTVLPKNYQGGMK
ncbi:ABC transporter permease [Ochrobactrum sp. BD67]